MLARPIRIKTRGGGVCFALKHHWQEYRSLQVQLNTCVVWGVEIAGSVTFTHSNHMTFIKTEDTLICHIIMHRNIINFLYNPSHVVVSCDEIKDVCVLYSPRLSVPGEQMVFVVAIWQFM